jgi:hypothetical protein
MFASFRITSLNTSTDHNVDKTSIMSTLLPCYSPNFVMKRVSPYLLSISRHNSRTNIDPHLAPCGPPPA